MASAQQGDQEAYRCFLAEVRPLIYRYCLRHAGPSLAEEATQETLLAIHKARDTYEASRPIRPWMTAIARYKVIDLLRKESRRKEFVLESPPEWKAPAPGHQDMHVWIEKALAGLAEKDRQILRLTKLEGNSYAEAANMMKTTEGNIKIRVHRAIGRLRSHLEKEARKGHL